MLLAALALALALGPGAGGAAALVVPLAPNHALSYVPLRSAAAARPYDQLFTNLEYGGGAVMASNTNYTVYWAPSGSPAYPVEYEAGINQYFEDLAHDSGGQQNVDSVSAQYNDRKGDFAFYQSAFGGAYVDTNPYPSNGCKQAAICLSDEQIRAELKSFVATNKLPVGLAHEYFVLTPPKVEVCFVTKGSEECSAGAKKAVFCAYHSSAPDAGAQLIYATDPYVTGNSSCDDGNHPNGSSSDGAIEGGLSHEHNESITDPVPDYGWVDLMTGEETGSENGDKCRGGGVEKEFGTPLGQVTVQGKKVDYNQVLAGRKYWYQQEWSDQGHRCLQRLTFAGAEPSATFTSTPGAGTDLTFNAGASTAPGGVKRYSWQFGEGGAPVETSEASVSHRFAEPGRYLVALTVFAQDGTALGSAQLVKTGDEGPAAAFSIGGSGSPPGATVTFNAAGSSDPDGAIAGYEWAFGDGSKATGASASHAYARAGTYVVTLGASDASGQSASISHAVEVSGADEAPSVSFSIAPASPTAGQPVSFTGSASDPDGTIAAYTWSFGDGSNGTGSSGPHTYAAAGTYSVTLTVTDSAGRSSSETQSVTVGAASSAGEPAAGAPASTGPAAAAALGSPASAPGPPAPSPALAGGPALVAVAATISRRTGAVMLATDARAAGTLAWSATFPNGRFGVYTAAHRCGPALMRLSGHCRPARIVFAKGSRPVSSAGALTLVLQPSRAALKALRRALRRGQALPVTVTLQFQPYGGGRTIVRTELLRVRLGRP